MSNRVCKQIGWVAALLLAGSALAWSDDVTGQQLMGRNFFVSKITAIKSQMTMVLVSANGQKRERKIETIAKLQKNGIDSNLLLRFQQPADIKGTAFLELEHADADDDLWIYLPALQKVRRLISNNKKDSFIGSDFSYGDILPPQVDLYKHTMLRVEKLEGQECFVVESLPLSDKVRTDSGYSKKISWLLDSGLEVKVEYYDLAGKLLKVQLARDPKLVEPDKNRWLALNREMTNVQTGHKTLISIGEIDTNIVIPDNLFSIRTLESK